ncbi:hypothetical protein DM02DRAFT_594342 [Periconia macrospinosa]|uniref:Altered inheritance of mitochondria protein 6 n=1 Tax=Periconia macrospinosa TaxID=97972 RepID=A0A2V1DQJ0_9PLEO|nr:hypothetical protein DM02DRAFT_594342 [Periconia macrospinosa]
MMAYFDSGKTASTTKPLLGDYETLDEIDSVSSLHKNDDAFVSVESFEENGESGFERSEGLIVKEGLLRRLLMAVVRRRRRRNGLFGRKESGEFGERERLTSLNGRRRGWVTTGFLKEAKFYGHSVRSILAVGLFILTFLSILLTIYLSPYPPTYLPPPSSSSSNTSLPPTDLSTLTNNVTPIPCHSHNDYWRPSPLYSALRTGCMGVEADVWLFSNELYVGHTERSLRREKTFKNMYVDPLVHLLDLQNANTSTPTNKNGIFTTDPTHPLILLIDFKPSPPFLLTIVFSTVSKALAPLREKNYLTYHNGTALIPGPITAVATGSAPFDLILSNETHRDIFYDAPLSSLPSQSHPGFSAENSYYASTSFRRSIGTLWFFRFSSYQRAKVRQQVKDAHERGLKARYWSTPSWPRGLRDKVWRVLREEGVDMLNGDDLEGLKRVLEEERVRV